MVEDVIRALRERYGDDWALNEDANLQFSVDVESILQDVEGAHLIGEPDFADGQVTLTMWVDFPIRDLMSADQLAYDIFARLCEEMFYAERRLEAKSVRYPFVTGSTSHGHIGALVLAGPHAEEFASLYQQWRSGGLRYQA